MNTGTDKLAAFGAWCAREFRDGLGNIEGGDAQDEMTRLGVLVVVVANEPCGEGCTCVEYGNFPHHCYRFPPDIKAALAAQEKK